MTSYVSQVRVQPPKEPRRSLARLGFSPLPPQHTGSSLPLFSLANWTVDFPGDCPGWAWLSHLVLGNFEVLLYGCHEISRP